MNATKGEFFQKSRTRLEEFWKVVSKACERTQVINLRWIFEKSQEMCTLFDSIFLVQVTAEDAALS